MPDSTHVPQRRALFLLLSSGVANCRRTHTSYPARPDQPTSVNFNEVSNGKFIIRPNSCRHDFLAAFFICFCFCNCFYCRLLCGDLTTPPTHRGCNSRAQLPAIWGKWSLWCILNPTPLPAAVKLRQGSLWRLLITLTYICIAFTRVLTLITCMPSSGSRDCPFFSNFYFSPGLSKGPNLNCRIAFKEQWHIYPTPWWTIKNLMLMWQAKTVAIGA